MIDKRKPVRAAGAYRKTFVSGKEFESWLKEHSDYVLANSYANEHGTEVFLLPADTKGEKTK